MHDAYDLSQLLKLNVQIDSIAAYGKSHIFIINNISYQTDCTLKRSFFLYFFLCKILTMMSHVFIG